MTKPDGVAPGTIIDDVYSSWGTWEELLLAFAVNRHGTAAWDSISSELQKRSSDPNMCLTPNNCRSKYLDLKRRFVVNNGDLDGGEDGRHDKSIVEESVSFLEELRKLRVAELRREVQRYDLHIESLESKMKRMEEERERGKADLENKSQEKRVCEPETVAVVGTETAAVELEKDQLSVNESNSTDLEAEKARTGEEGSEPAGAREEEGRNDRTGQTSGDAAELKSGPDQKSDSCNGSSNSIDEPDRKAKKAEPVAEPEDEFNDGGAEATKESSDVQSSASRSRTEGSDMVRRGSTSGDEREHENQSRALKEFPAESQPLVEFLHAIRTPKLGSIFDRRLRSQETSKYQKLILQHIDLETVETRLKQGWYSGSATKFFRDLLLFVNNALVFFSSNSPEAIGALEIRRLILKEISHKHAKSDSSPGKQISLQSLSLSKIEETEASPSLMLKPRISGSLIVCRKRSSIAAKSTASSSSGAPLLVEEKEPKPLSDAEEPKITKKRRRDRFPVNTKKNGKNHNGKQSSAAESVKQQGKGEGSSETKGDSKKSQSPSDSKKRSAANFLNRMKQGSSSNNNGVLLDALKNTPLPTSKITTGKGGSDQKNNENAKKGEKKEAAATKRAEAKKAKEKERTSPGKRNVGRPPKRGAAPPTPAMGKRGRDRGEPAGTKQPKKRSRKL